MSNDIDDEFIRDAVDWSVLNGLVLKKGSGTVRHCPFSAAPVLISKAHLEQLKTAVALMGKMIHAVSEDHDFLMESLGVLEGRDCLFDHLLTLHRQLHAEGTVIRRQPLLIMRTDFMDDAQSGPKVIEFNGIAAGMGPFGEQAHRLHAYLQRERPHDFYRWTGVEPVELVPNTVIDKLARGVAETAFAVRRQRGDQGPPVFLMVVQPDEDNVYDQKLLEMALQSIGVRTVRRTFRQLHDQLSTGEQHRLNLDKVGTIDVVYLRAGYQVGDYIAKDIQGYQCCEALGKTRAFIEQHHVAMNATISQQLATSKRIQALLSSMTPQKLARFGLTVKEAVTVKSFLGEMNLVNTRSSKWFSEQNPAHWVLKNQGEGGGHCIFDEGIEVKLQELDRHPEYYPSWVLMRRLRPRHRPHAVLLVREGSGSAVEDLISEIGLFTLHFNGQPMSNAEGYAGYLIRSKPTGVAEGGVHSGMGAVDSLAFV